MENTTTTNEVPAFTILLNILAYISVGFGIAACAAFFPEKLEYGESWKPIAYLPSVAALAAGVMQGLLFAALGQIISYLSIIALNKHADPDDRRG